MEPFNVKRGSSSDMYEVNLIVTGPQRWAALLSDGSVLLLFTKQPRSEVAAALLRQGADPRSLLTIRAGSEIVACDTLGSMGGSPVTCSDEGQMSRTDRLGH
jgi:hypothetical protein